MRRIRNYFYSLRSESKRIWVLFASYSHVSVYSQTPFICIIRLIFASKYSHKFAYKYSFDPKQIYFLTLAHICFKIFVLKQIFASLEVNFTFKRIFARKYSHTSEYSLANIRIPVNIRFVLLRIIKESRSQS